MIKILHIVHALTMGGGLANFIMNYYRVIDRTKIQFDFIYFRDSERSFNDEIEQLGGRCFKFIEPLHGFGYIQQANHFFNEHRNEYIAVHCHALFATVAYGHIAKQHGIKHVIAHAHSSIYGEGIFRTLRNYLIIQLTRLIATEKYACSEKTARFMFGNKSYLNGEVHIVKNAINVERYKFDKNIRTAMRKEMEIDDNIVFGHVGGFVPTKNHRYILEVFKRICDNEEHAILLLVGGEGIAAGSTKNEIKRLVAEYNLSDKVMFLGIRNDVNKLLMAMDALIFPSIFEGLPFSLIEAQTTGLSCYVSETITHEVDIGRCTFLSIEDDAEVWANRILHDKLSLARGSGYKSAIECGYSIQEEALNLSNRYYNMQE